MAQKSFNITSDQYGFSICVLTLPNSQKELDNFRKIFNFNLHKNSGKNTGSSYIFAQSGDKFAYAVIPSCSEKEGLALSGKINGMVACFIYESHAYAYRNTIYDKGEILDDWIYDDGDDGQEYDLIKNAKKGNMSARYKGKAVTDNKSLDNVDKIMDIIYSYYGLVVPGLSKFPGNDKKVNYQYVYELQDIRRTITGGTLANSQKKQKPNNSVTMVIKDGKIHFIYPGKGEPVEISKLSKLIMKKKMANKTPKRTQ